MTSNPMVYVITNDKDKQSTGQVHYINSYEELLEKLKKRQLRTTQSLKK